MKKDPYLTVLLAWLVPGGGHWVVGRRGKAGIFCVVLIAMFALGLVLTGGGCVDIARHPYAAVLQACTGVPMGVALLATAGAPEPPASKLSDFGMLLTLVAGALKIGRAHV